MHPFSWVPFEALRGKHLSIGFFVLGAMMKQVVQSTRGGTVALVEAGIPLPQATEVLVRTEATVVSPGTERYMTGLAQSNLVAKAKARPDLVRQVVDRARKEGLRSTVDTVRAKLDDDLLLGYSGAGVIAELGSLVRGLRVGQLVATAGGGYASHAHYQTVPQTLVAPVPDGVSAEQAAFATIASIALHGFRLADVGVGSKVVVVGLGLIGQLACRLATSAGCDVAAVDVDPQAVAQAEAHGALGLREQGAATTAQILAWSRGRGADAVLIAAGARGDSRIIKAVPPRCRDRGTVVAIGDVGLDLDRNDFYHHELELKVARSYGPGRYDPSYEEWAVDYPVGYVRWTEGRNLEAVLDLMAAGRLDVSDLISHRYPIDAAPTAYEALQKGKERIVGIVFRYPESERKAGEAIDLGSAIAATQPSRRHTGRIGIGVCGAGQFTRRTIIPSIQAAGLGDIVHISSSSGVSAARVATRENIGRNSSGVDEVLSDPAVDLVVVATPHSTHGELVVQALEAGRHVYVEKPLAITENELTRIEKTLAGSEAQLHVGFNRRWSPMIVHAREALAGAGPITVDYRVSAGPIGPGHWYVDRREGGRLLGEVCHFIDTANALVASKPVTIACTGPNDDRHDNYGLLIGYADGSIATITYAADGSQATPKERCEILGRGHTIVIDDYREIIVDGRKAKVEPGKGHVESLRSLAGALRAGEYHDPAYAFVTTRIALRALRSLHEARGLPLGGEADGGEGPVVDLTETPEPVG